MSHSVPPIEQFKKISFKVVLVSKEREFAAHKQKVKAGNFIG